MSNRIHDSFLAYLEQLGNQGSEESITRPAVSPGKRSLTMSLPPRPGVAEAPVQRKPDPAADAARAQRAKDTEHWMNLAVRPDLDGSVASAGLADPTGRELPDDGARRSMPEAVQAKMSQAFDTDFSSVRIHEGAQSQALGARAFTQGTNIHFAPGHYQPDSPSGQALLGHELAHVVQQSEGRVQATTQRKGVGVNDSVGLEREADEMGARAARGERVGGNTLSGALANRSAGGDTPVVQGAGLENVSEDEVGALFAASGLELDNFKELVAKWAGALQATPLVRPSVKAMDRSIDKAAKKSVEGQTDTLAGTLQFDTLAAMASGIQRLPEVLAADGATVVRQKNRIKDQAIRDFLVNVKLASGLIVEVQLHLKDVIEAKQGQPKKVYAADDRGQLERGQNGGLVVADVGGLDGGMKHYNTHDAYDFTRIIGDFTNQLVQLRFPTDSERYPDHMLSEEQRRQIRNQGTPESRMQVHRHHNAQQLVTVLDTMSAVYAQIQDFIMSRAWRKVMSHEGSDDALDQLTAADDATFGIADDAPQTQDLGAIMGNLRERHQPDDANATNPADAAADKQARAAKQLIDAKLAALRGGDGGDAAPDAMTQVKGVVSSYHKMLTDKMAEKEAHGTRFVQGSGLENLRLVLEEFLRIN